MQLVDVLRKHAGKACVCELVPLFDLSQPTVSHHLKVLREAGIVGSERRGLWAYYYVIPSTGGAERMAEQLTANDDIREAVRERYAQAAESVGEGRVACCGPSDATGGSCGCGTDVPDACEGKTFGSELYSISDRDELPDAAKLASLGCGNPTAVAELARARRSSTWAPGAASTSFSQPAGSARPGRPTGWT